MKKEVCPMSGTRATVVADHRSQAVLLLHFGATGFYEDSSVLFLWTSNIAPVTVFAYCQLPEQSSSEDVSLSMEGDAWQDVSLVICD